MKSGTDSASGGGGCQGTYVCWGCCSGGGDCQGTCVCWGCCSGGGDCQGTCVCWGCCSGDAWLCAKPAVQPGPRSGSEGGREGGVLESHCFTSDRWRRGGGAGQGSDSSGLCLWRRKGRQVRQMIQLISGQQPH